MKKIIIFMLVVLFILPVSLFAQGGKEESTGEITINWPCIWVGTDSKAATIAAIVDEFNASHAGEIKVIIEDQPDYDAYTEALRTRFAANQVPDIFTYKPGPSSDLYLESDKVVDLTPYLEAGWKENFTSSTLAITDYDGQNKGIPYEIAVAPIWYNEDLFKEAGIDKFPTTMDEFWTACDKLKAKGIYPTAQMTGGGNAWTSMLWYSHFVTSFGGPDVWDRKWDDPAFEKAADIMKRLYLEYTSPDAVGADAAVAGGHFQAGRTAMFINGPWYVGNLLKNAPAVYEATNVAPAPKAGDNYGHQLGWLQAGIAVGNSGDQRKTDAVVEFLKYLTAPENAKRITLASGALLAMPVEFTAEDTVPELLKEIIKCSDEATFQTNHLEGEVDTSVILELGQALGSMVLEDGSAKDFVSQLASI